MGPEEHGRSRHPNLNVLNYAHEVFEPIDPGYWSILGVRNLEDLIAQVRQHMDHEALRIGGVLLTKIHERGRRG